MGAIEIEFKRTTGTKYWSEISPQQQNHYIDFLIDPSFQRVNGM